MSDIANQTIRYALSVVLENGNVRQLPRSYKDWNKAAEQLEQSIQRSAQVEADLRRSMGWPLREKK